MSQISRVIKNKNRIEKENRIKRTREIRQMREFSMYRNRLNEDIKKLELILEDESVKTVTISVKDSYESMFLELMYSEELSEYSIRVLDKGRFSIGRKLVSI